MAETLLMSSTALPADIVASDTKYLDVAGWMNVHTFEADTNMPIYTDGRLSNLLVLVEDNDLDGTDTTLVLRKNGADTALNLTFPWPLTGEFSDDNDIVTVEPGDLLSYKLVAGSSSDPLDAIYLQVARMIFTPEPDEDTVTKQNAVLPGAGGDDYSSASTTYFAVLCGSAEAISVTENDIESVQLLTGTYRSLAVNVSSNDRTTSTTVRLRLNNANTTLVTTIGAGLTGWFEDTTHSVAVVPDDDVNYSLTTGTGVGSLLVRSFSCEFVNTDSRGLYTAGNMGNPTEVDVTKYWPIMGLLAYTSSEGHIAIDSGLKQVDWIDFACTVSQNNLDATSTVKVRNNRINTDVTISIPANTTGKFSDTTASQTSSYPSDEINIRVATGTGGVTDTITLTSTTLSAFIVPFTGEKSLSMSSANPVFTEYHNYQQQSNFFSTFTSPMFGD